MEPFALAPQHKDLNFSRYLRCRLHPVICTSSPFPQEAAVFSQQILLRAFKR